MLVCICSEIISLHFPTALSWVMTGGVCEVVTMSMILDRLAAGCYAGSAPEKEMFCLRATWWRILVDVNMGLMTQICSCRILRLIKAPNIVLVLLWQMEGRAPSLNTSNVECLKAADEFRLDRGCIDRLLDGSFQSQERWLHPGIKHGSFHTLVPSHSVSSDTICH